MNKNEILERYASGMLELYVPASVACVIVGISQREFRKYLDRTYDPIPHIVKETRRMVETAAIKPYFRRHQVCQEKNYLEDEQDDQT